jgi:hypothetical protein
MRQVFERTVKPEHFPAMKKPTRKSPPAAQVPDDELLPEYDLSHARPSKFAALYDDLNDVTIVSERKNEKTISLTEMKRRLKKKSAL